MRLGSSSNRVLGKSGRRPASGLRGITTGFLGCGRDQNYRRFSSSSDANVFTFFLLGKFSRLPESLIIRIEAALRLLVYKTPQNTVENALQSIDVLGVPHSSGAFLSQLSGRQFSP